VGATNRTRIEDYRDAVTERTRLILRVHPSNFHIAGFTGKPQLTELVALGRERNIPVYEDLGSGCLVDLKPWGVEEPLASASLEAGVNLISFSGDKLLGGPQAGILAGDAELVARLRRNPMFRALRLDKLITGALEATLRDLLFSRWDRIPALAMITLAPEQIRRRSETMVQSVGIGQVIEGRSVIGGGSTPDQSLPTWLVAIEHTAVNVLERELREGDPAVVARIEDDRLVMDLRTVFESEESELLAAVRRALDSCRRTC
jgi:L-seryl-tRNA(Ser) seleniumtransferase